LKRQINVGGSSVVYLGERVSTLEEVAVKVINAKRDSPMNPAGNEESFVKKIEFDSPYLLRYFEVFDEGTRKFFVMELCECDLKSMIKEYAERNVEIPENVLSFCIRFIFVREFGRFWHRLLLDCTS
jgi:serine/threonine protein kinase